MVSEPGPHNAHGRRCSCVFRRLRDLWRTRYGAYQWRPLHWRVAGLDVGAGVALGAFDGYPNYRHGGWFVAPLPVLAIEGTRFGVNLSVIPTIRNRLDGALAVQVKLRVW